MNDYTAAENTVVNSARTGKGEMPVPANVSFIDNSYSGNSTWASNGPSEISWGKWLAIFPTD